jgi:hypothetical protein
VTDPITAALDAYVPAFEAAEGNWQAILSAASVPASVSPPLRASRRTRRHLLRRRNVLVALVVVAIVAPLAAVAANRWWFLRAGLPHPTKQPNVVTRGSWSGHQWELVAYPSKGYGLCWGITFPGHTPRIRPGIGQSYSSGMAVHGVDDGMGCGAIVGLRHWNPADLPTVMFESDGTNEPGYPTWIAGAVAASATHAVIRWRTGKAIRVRTFATPVAGYRVRLFATPVPQSLSPFFALTSISGINQRGQVVACFNAKVVSTNGVYPLSYCKP